MNDIDELLHTIDVPATDPAADVARGERSLRRHRRLRVSASALSVAAVAALGIAAHGASGSPGARGFADGTDSVPRSPHAGAERSAAARMEARLLHQAAQVPTAIYRRVLAEHLDPTGGHLRGAQNEQGGGGTYGTKLDWNHGGMLEIVVSRYWGGAGHFYQLETAGLTPTTYDGHPARVSTKGDDLVVSAQHADGTIVTLIASTSFGNNGTSTPTLGLTQDQLLAAAADPRLMLPRYLR